jgi:hypothetical protein
MADFDAQRRGEARHRHGRRNEVTMTQTTQDANEATMGAVASTAGLGPLSPAAWMEPGRHWTLESEEWMAHHRKDAHSNVQATLAAKTECLYRLTPEDVAAVNAARKERASKALRRLDLCRCDHNEYCGHCFPVEFRPGGMWGGHNA